MPLKAATKPAKPRLDIGFATNNAPAALELWQRNHAGSPALSFVIASRHSGVRAKYRGTLGLMAGSNRSSRLALFAACAMFAWSNRLRRVTG